MTKFYLTTVALTLCSFLAAAQQSSDMKSWQYPYDVHHISVLDSLEIAYIDEGTGPVALFIHGLGSNLQAWKKTVDTLRLHHRCIAIDLPGYGKSSGGDLPYSMSFFADAIIALVEALELEEVSLIGHSMGGQVSMHVALRKHPSIKHLALMAPAGFEQFTTEEQQWFATYVRPAFIQATSEAQIVRNFELNFHEMPDDARFMINDRLEMRADTQAYEAYSEMIPKCVQAMLQEPVFSQLDQIAIPTLVIYGAEDELIPNRILHPSLTTSQVAEAGTRALGNAEHHMLASAGHFVQWEQSEKVNQLLISFFRSNP
ncbi:MAG: alpha/beta fold hydrolase [Bacteroidota bacterium]